MKKYWTIFTEDYLSHWTVANGIREYCSNALDSKAALEYEFGDDFIIFTSKDITLPAKIFAVGYSQHRKDPSANGQFGEGVVAGMFPLLREGKGIQFINGNVIWKPAFEYNEGMDIETLVINEEINPHPTNDFSVVIDNLTSEEIQEVKDNCIYFRDDLGEVIEGSIGSIIKGIQGKLFVGGVFVKDIGSSYQYSFNFKPEHFSMNRDRATIDNWDLARQTSILIKELLDPREIAKLVEERKPEVSNIHHRNELTEIAEACYDNIVEKYGEDVVICQWYDDQDKLEKKGYKNVVNVSHGNYYDIIVQSPRYKEKLAELTEQLDIEPEDTRTPLEMLEDWYNQNLSVIAGDCEEMLKFEAILETFRSRGVTFDS